MLKDLIYDGYFDTSFIAIDGGKAGKELFTTVAIANAHVTVRNAILSWVALTPPINDLKEKLR